jgi:hypothetical protein
VIGYDPHVKNTSVGRIIAQVGRDADDVIYAWYNGDRATNRSPSTGLLVKKWQSSLDGSDLETPVCGITVDIGRFGAYIRTYIARPQPASGDTGSSAWLTYANTGYPAIGVLSEVIVFNRKLSETERQKVYGYLSRKYKMEKSLPDSYWRSHHSAYSLDAGLTYWAIEHHPNNKSITTIPAGVCFGGITLSKFFKLPDAIYKSANTRLQDGTVLSGDTYSNIGL